MTFMSSTNFLRKSELRRAALSGMPIVLYSPEQAMPAINGVMRVVGPWPGTRPPVEDIKDYRSSCRCTKPRERVTPWHADVVVREMQIMEVR